MPRIAYADPDDLEDPDLREELRRAMLHSTPRPEIQAIRARQPEVLRAFIHSWDRLFRNGIVDLHVKELCRLRVSQTLDCDY
jgi:alkylhydroperoxidase family enzyme